MRLTLPSPDVELLAICFTVNGCNASSISEVSLPSNLSLVDSFVQTEESLIVLTTARLEATLLNASQNVLVQ